MGIFIVVRAASRPQMSAPVEAHSEGLGHGRLGGAIETLCLLRGKLEALEAERGIKCLGAHVFAAHNEPNKRDLRARERPFEKLRECGAPRAAPFVGHQQTLHIDTRAHARAIVGDEVPGRLAVTFDDPMRSTSTSSHRGEMLGVAPLTDELAIVGMTLERRDKAKILGAARAQPYGRGQCRLLSRHQKDRPRD